jgi:hypothetical protein
VASLDWWRRTRLRQTVVAARADSGAAAAAGGDARARGEEVALGADAAVRCGRGAQRLRRRGCGGAAAAEEERRLCGRRRGGVRRRRSRLGFGGGGERQIEKKTAEKTTDRDVRLRRGRSAFNAITGHAGRLTERGRPASGQSPVSS